MSYNVKFSALNILAVIMMASASFSAEAAQLQAGPKKNSSLNFYVDNISRNDGNIIIDLILDLTNVSMKSNYEMIYTPMLVNDIDTVRFESFTIAGRKRLLSDRRNDRVDNITFYKGKLVGAEYGSGNTIRIADNTTYRLQHAPNSVAEGYTYQLTAPYQPWMDDATLIVDSSMRGCANCMKKINGEEEIVTSVAQTSLITRPEFTPDFIYVTPVAEAVKTRELAARAYIDFRVNRTEIDPEYRRNPQELAKIRGTIDSIRSDKDITVTSLHISGTASPEGSYQNNVRLAKGRTEALKDYVQGLYRFRPGFITTSFEPVDWQGLREFLEMVVSLQNTDGIVTPSDSIRIDQFANISFDPATIGKTLPNAESILNIVNGSTEPYQKNQNIKNNYGTQYQWLLANVYPALRHSDYRIEFEIKTYTQAEEIIEVMQDAPQKLSLNELFVAAQSQPEGSELYNRAFELAVVMYPGDETANLNAGVNALKRGDLVSARKYLALAGNSPEANLNRAMLAQQEGNNTEAIILLEALTRSSNDAVAGKAVVLLETLNESLLPEELTFTRL